MDEFILQPISPTTWQKSINSNGIARVMWGYYPINYDRFQDDNGTGFKCAA